MSIHEQNSGFSLANHGQQFQTLTSNLFPGFSEQPESDDRQQRAMEIINQKLIAGEVVVYERDNKLIGRAVAPADPENPLSLETIVDITQSVDTTDPKNFQAGPLRIWIYIANDPEEPLEGGLTMEDFVDANTAYTASGTSHLYTAQQISTLVATIRERMLSQKDQTTKEIIRDLIDSGYLEDLKEIGAE